MLGSDCLLSNAQAQGQRLHLLLPFSCKAQQQSAEGLRRVVTSNYAAPDNSAAANSGGAQNIVANCDYAAPHHSADDCVLDMNLLFVVFWTPNRKMSRLSAWCQAIASQCCLRCSAAMKHMQITSAFSTMAASPSICRAVAFVQHLEVWGWISYL